jgi:pilus assembly protein FimV
MRHKQKGIASAVAMALGFTLVLSPVAGHALGLGGLKVHSALNEPLNAEIDITAASEKELKGLAVSLPSRAEFEAAGVERQPYQSLIQFVVSKRLDGRYFLHLRTDSPIDEPFLHLLLQAEWPGGKLVREYTALIDPPYQVVGKPAAVEPPVSAEPAPAPEAPAVPAEVPAPAVGEAPAAVAPAATEEQIKAEMEAEAKAGQFAAAPAEQPAPAPTASAPAMAEPSGSGFVPEAAAPMEQPMPQPESPKAEMRPEPAPGGASAAAPVVARTVPAWSSMSEYRVREGDTLWEISTKVRADRQVSIEQVVLALYRNNRDAFFGNNVNNLKAGKILRVPEREEVETVSSSLARKEFRAQYDVWQEYKLKLASSGRGVTVAGGETEAPVPVAKGEVAAAPKQEPAKAMKEVPPKPGEAAPVVKGGQPDELLKIVRETQKGAPGKQVAETEAAKDTGGSERQALAERVTTLEESLLSKQVEQKELGEKIGQVRALLKKETRLIEIERKEVATAPKAPASTIPTEPVKPEPVKPVEAPKAVVPEPAKPVESAPVPTQVPAPEAKKPAAPRTRVTAPTPPPAEERGFIESMMDDFGGIFLPIIVGVVVLLSGGIALVYMRRRHKSIAEFEESILSSEAISAETPTTSETTTTGAHGAAPAGDTSFLSDFSQGGMGNLHTDEVDPIAEAEVYLAYGRDETAEEILKEAVVKNPQREEIKVKLLEIYHQRNDVKAFETLAEEYYAQLGGRPSKLWTKVEEMGRKLNPDNPMFRGGAPAKSGAKAAPTPSMSPAFAETLGGAATPMAPSMAPAPAGIEFDLGAASAAGEVPAGDTGLDFDLNQSGGGIDFEDTLKSGTSARARAESSLESLDFGKPADSMIEFDAGKPAVESPAGDAGLDWDVGAAVTSSGGGGEEVALAEAPVQADEAAPSQWDETATKLDLAKAYVDMGDAEGARSILNEVIAEGNETQKKQAQELASQIG